MDKARYDGAYVVAGVLLFAAHMLASRPEFDPLARALLAVPLIPLLWEIRRALNADDDGVPLIAFALFTYYLGFSTPAFVEGHFKSVRGIVYFTDEARLVGAAAVALGGVVVHAGMRLGERLGLRSRFFTHLVPPAPPRDSFPTAVVVYVAITAVVMATPLPVTLTQLFDLSFSSYLAIGFVASAPEQFRTGRLRYIFGVLFGLGAATTLYSGMIEPLYRHGIAIFVVRWRYFRQTHLRLALVLTASFLVLQPVKHAYRHEFWKSQQQTVSQSVEAWGHALDSFFSDRPDVQTDKISQSATRLGELDSLTYAMMEVPRRVPFANGAGWMDLPIRWIPRLVWPDKPTTATFEQRYAVVFGLQTELGARMTAITLPLLADGYWNFGWPGIVMACLIIGLWTGFAQGAFRGHWALRVFAVQQLSVINLVSTLQTPISGLPQALCGWLLACWGVYGLSMVLSRQRPARAAPSRALLRQRV